MKRRYFLEIQQCYKEGLNEQNGEKMTSEVRQGRQQHKQIIILREIWNTVKKETEQDSPSEN